MTKKSAEPSEFGRYLQQVRRDKEIPLEAVSQVTKIRLIVLQQIEKEDLEALPPATITKGFIRAFADAVGADQDEALKLYAAALGAQAPKVQQVPAIIQPEPRPVWRNLLLAGALIVLLIAASLYLFNKSERSGSPPPAQKPEAHQPQHTPSGEDAEPTVEPAAESTPGQSETIVPGPLTVPDEKIIEAQEKNVQEENAAIPEEIEAAEAAPEKEAMSTPPSDSEPEATQAPSEKGAAPPETPGEKLVLEVSTTELTYMSIAVDDGDPRELMIREGRRLRYEAQHRFQLVIGNAAGVELRLNGKPVVVPGGSGKVVHLDLP